MADFAKVLPLMAPFMRAVSAFRLSAGCPFNSGVR